MWVYKEYCGWGCGNGGKMLAFPFSHDMIEKWEIWFERKAQKKNECVAWGELDVS